MNSKPIPFYKPALPPLEDYIPFLEQIWSSRMLSNFSEFAQRLEKQASSYLGSPYVKAVVSADIGLIITLKSLGLKPGAPCYISDFTFNSTINAALWAGLRPVVLDIDPETLNLSTDGLRQALKDRNEPGVVLATHVFGNPADVETLKLLAREHECFIVYDAAHALGSRVAGKSVGCFGDAEVFSLSGTKMVTSAEGGLISTPHQWLAEKIGYFRAYGFQNDYNSRYVGINGKISEIHCALAVLSLKQIEESVARRQEIVQFYRSQLGDRVIWQTVRPQDRSTYKDVIISLGSSRSKVQALMNDDNIQTKRYFLPLHFMKPYQEFCAASYPVTQQVYESSICIPAYADLTEEDLARISTLILTGLESS